MCVLYTFDKQVYVTNKAAIERRVTSDAKFNSDGGSLLLMGADDDSATLVRSFDVTLLLDILQARLGVGGAATRAWLHLRYATTGFRGVNGCHGFAAGDHTVFHNGVLARHDSKGFLVDSELIAADVASHGVTEAVARLQAGDAYANVMIVDNQTGAYTVVRQTVGDLFTDGAGNYSTVAVGPIKTPVAVGTVAEHGGTVVEREPPDRWDYWDGDLVDTVAYLGSPADVADVADYEGWWSAGVPSSAWDEFDLEQQRWASELGLAKQRRRA